MSSFGEQIEEYEVLNLLGKGGFASVYRAKCLTSQMEVAIKMIDKKRMGAADMVERVRQEVAIHSRLKHPAVLELYTFFEDTNYVYLVLELCHNGELQRYLKNNAKTLSENEVTIDFFLNLKLMSSVNVVFVCFFAASHILKQVVEGLIYLHSHNILHRDMSLANLLLTNNMQVVATRSSHGLETDVWGLGCMLYTMLVGRPPFDTDAVKSTLTRVVMANYEVPPHLSIEAKDLIESLLKKNPKDRIPLRRILDHPFMKREHHNEFLPQLCSDATVDSGMGTMSTNTQSSRTRDTYNPLTKSRARSEERFYNHQPNPNAKFSVKSTDENCLPTRTQQPFSDTGAALPTCPSKLAHSRRTSASLSSLHEGFKVSTSRSVVSDCPKEHSACSGGCASQRGKNNLTNRKISYTNSSNGCCSSSNQSSHSSNNGQAAFMHIHNKQAKSDCLGKSDGSNYHASDNNLHFTYETKPRQCSSCSIGKIVSCDDGSLSNTVQHSKTSQHSHTTNDCPSPPCLRHRKNLSGFKNINERPLSNHHHLQCCNASSECVCHQEKSSLGSNETKSSLICKSYETRRLEEKGFDPSCNDFGDHDDLFEERGKQTCNTIARNILHQCIRESTCECQKNKTTTERTNCLAESEEFRPYKKIPENTLKTSNGEVYKPGPTAQPLNSARLQPTRHRTKNAVLSILESGEVVIEFLKKRGDKVSDVCRISGDGLRVILYHAGNDGVPLKHCPPELPPNGADAIHSFESLPQKYWKKYLYASRFVELVKAKTPKVTYYSEKAKCLLMENTPDPDFEVAFYNGGKVTKTGEGVKIIDPGGDLVMKPGENVEEEFLCPATRLLYQHYQQCYAHCCRLEAVLSELREGSPGPTCFPVIVGRRPVTPLKPTWSSNKENITPPQAPTLQSFDVSLVSSVQPKARLHKPSRGYTMDIPHVGVATQMLTGEVEVQYLDGSKLTVHSEGGLIKYVDSCGRWMQYAPTDCVPEIVKNKLKEIPTVIRNLITHQQSQSRLRSLSRPLYPSYALAQTAPITLSVWSAPQSMFSEPSVMSYPLYSAPMRTPVSIGSLGGH
uniref:Serine/threonine-protein kinase PLK4 n=1 Tax=Timema cristinae TaxID=61476 RepID=A0A7R9CAT7_TIMCR|nr:unnamed protein product [Timema cristinae]